MKFITKILVEKKLNRVLSEEERPYVPGLGDSLICPYPSGIQPHTLFTSWHLGKAYRLLRKYKPKEIIKSVEDREEFRRVTGRTTMSSGVREKYTKVCQSVKDVPSYTSFIKIAGWHNETETLSKELQNDLDKLFGDIDDGCDSSLGNVNIIYNHFDAYKNFLATERLKTFPSCLWFLLQFWAFYQGQKGQELNIQAKEFIETRAQVNELLYEPYKFDQIWKDKFKVYIRSVKKIEKLMISIQEQQRRMLIYDQRFSKTEEGQKQTRYVEILQEKLDKLSAKSADKLERKLYGLTIAQQKKQNKEVRKRMGLKGEGRIRSGTGLFIIELTEEQKKIYWQWVYEDAKHG